MIISYQYREEDAQELAKLEESKLVYFAVMFLIIFKFTVLMHALVCLCYYIVNLLELTCCSFPCFFVPIQNYLLSIMLEKLPRRLLSHNRVDPSPSQVLVLFVLIKVAELRWHCTFELNFLQFV
jgi:hypothetical protein